MPTAIRQLKINGYLLTETASATILVNGVESYNGPLAPGVVGPTDPSEQIALATFDYVGQLDTDETIDRKTKIHYHKSQNDEKCDFLR